MLTVAQSATLLAAAKADGALTAFRAALDDKAIAAYYNAVPASPVAVWRPSITPTEINTAIVGTEFAALSQLKQNMLLLMMTGPIDATSTNVQNNFSAVFGASTTLTNLTALAKRPATRFEALFISNGVTSVFGQSLTSSDVASVLRNDDGSAK